MLIREEQTDADLHSTHHPRSRRDWESLSEEPSRCDPGATRSSIGRGSSSTDDDGSFPTALRSTKGDIHYPAREDKQNHIHIK